MELVLSCSRLMNSGSAMRVARLVPIQHVGIVENKASRIAEPDFTYVYDKNVWLTRAPLPDELPNVQAPIFHYIRMLRISYEVIKKYRPETYITTGGVGYAQFMDALLRYTDNPNSILLIEDAERRWHVGKSPTGSIGCSRRCRRDRRAWPTAPRHPQ